jgi:hypothetical protein
MKAKVLIRALSPLPASPSEHVELVLSAKSVAVPISAIKRVLSSLVLLGF